ncbi:shikimate kinase [Pradoshia eiseniae]|uniref:Shikimate kinase n=1 Tax=Pradoshia eiseniae TaxID=2064768 RepID=A0A2S7N3D7_9BACI|nr:shikimate kinase [Pradoshia eiseniae]PQD96529.1 shikimate kinase [Pradoshia eiseniae]
MKAIYLIGFMGTGKTTISHALGEHLNVPVTDCDEAIVQYAGKSIPRIFEEEGEQGFRDIEQQTLRQLHAENHIVATGGGVVLREENRAHMKKNGIIIWLEASTEEILKRLDSDKTRPLLTGGDMAERIQTLFDARKELYEGTAHMRIDTTGKAKDEIVHEILSHLDEYDV